MADRVQDELFGSYPRRVGTPMQQWIWSGGQFDLFAESVNGRRNAYATVGRLELTTSEGPDGQERLTEDGHSDKVVYDLDSPAKSEKDGVRWDIFDDDPTDDEVAAMMFDDPDVAEQILGKPCEDAQKLAQRSIDDNVPVIGVFTGFGLHVHQLFERREDPAKAMTTTHQRYVEECDLETPDPAIVGQPERLVRIPNCQRVTTPGPDHVVMDGRPTGLWHIPLSGRELTQVTPQWLVDHCTGPRLGSVSVPTERPRMRVWPDYEDVEPSTTEGGVPEREIVDEVDLDDSGIEEIVRGLLCLPCMAERILFNPNPGNEVRVNATVMLLNRGLDPQTIADLYSWIGWIDFDRQLTLEKIRHIERKGYSEMNCSTLRSRGLCRRSDDPESCKSYGWRGQPARWK